MTTALESPSVAEQPEEGNQAITVTLQTRPFLPSEIEKAGDQTLDRGVEVKGKNMIVKLDLTGFSDHLDSFEASFRKGEKADESFPLQDLKVSEKRSLVR